MASGRGSNAEAIIKSCISGYLNAEPALIVSNIEHAGVHDIAQSYSIPSIHLARDQFENGVEFAYALINAFENHNVDLILLAGYMRKVPGKLIQRFDKAMLNRRR